MSNDTMLTDWFEVSLLNAPPSNRIMWGIIADNLSGRWLPSVYVCKSPVSRQTDDYVVITGY